MQRVFASWARRRPPCYQAPEKGGARAGPLGVRASAVLAFFVAVRWGWSPPLAAALAATFLIVDFSYRYQLRREYGFSPGSALEPDATP